MTEQNLIDNLTMQCHLDSLSWFPDQARDLTFMTLAVAGEVGEFANLLKKVERGSLDYADPEVKLQMAEELCDIFIYLLNAAAIMNVNLANIYEMKREKNVERFGQPDHQAAIDRLRNTGSPPRTV
jgi:NTP pyrophosphatase (non-canonical NTP hydrolase)